MIPKIEFKWSWIFEQTYHANNVKSEEFDFGIYGKETKEFIDQLNTEWNKIGSKVLEVLNEESGLKWKEEKIICYVIKRSTMHPISDPITIPIEVEMGEKVFPLSVNRYIDMFIHELIHNLMDQNEDETEEYFGKVFDIYKEEEFDTTIHVLLHALHKKVFEQAFDEDRLKAEIEANNFYDAYKRSWDIVEEKGADKIISELTNPSSDSQTQEHR